MHPPSPVSPFSILLSPFFLLLLPLAAAAAPVDPDNPPPGLFADFWLEVRVGGAKAGYAHMKMVRDGDRVRTLNEMQLKLGRGAFVVELASTEATVETVAGKPLEFENRTVMAGQPVVKQGRFEDGKVVIVSSQLGMTQTDTHPVKEECLSSWGLFRESIRRGFAPGTSYTLPAYSPDLRPDGPVAAAVLMGADEEFAHGGGTLRGRKMTMTLKAKAGTIESVSWLDPDGNPLKTVLTAGGMQFEMVRVDQASAVAAFVPAEIFMDTLVRSNRPLNAAKARRVRCTVRVTGDGKGLPDLPATEMQAPVRKGAREAEVTLTRQDWGTLRRAAPGPGPGDEFLASNVMLKTDDPQVMALAAEAAAGAADPFDAADRLRKFVGSHIRKKSLDVGFATASDVARSREGDCSEHAVLLAALGRARGLPSRLAVGLAYVPEFGGRKEVFGFHMWTQFWLGGAWVDVDAALEETQCSPTRIAFAVSSLKDASVAELGLALLDVIGRLKIEIAEVEEQPAAE